MTTISTAPTLGLAQAAKAAGVSESTLRRRRSEMLALGAVQTDKGWQIPVPVLVQMGLMDRTTGPDPQDGDSPSVKPSTATLTALTTPGALEALTAQLEAIRERLADAEKRAAVAEAVAQERERIIEAQQMALRMLEAPKPSQTATALPDMQGPAASPESRPERPIVPNTEQQPARRRWWRW